MFATALLSYQVLSTVHTLIHMYKSLRSHSAIECGSLSDIEDGRVIIASRTVGSTARYICNPGFELVGEETRTCQSDGDWSGVEPYCKCRE